MARTNYTFDMRTKRGTLDAFAFLRDEMESQGFDKKTLAKEADISAGTLGRWFGKKAPTARGPFARQLHAAFGALGRDVTTKHRK